MNSNAQKIKAILLYILKNITEERRDVYGIVKAAFYAQQSHFVDWGLPLFRDEISPLPFGPVPSSMYDILKLARGEQKAVTYLKDKDLKHVADAIGFKDERFSAKESPDMDLLSVADLESLDKAIAKVSSMNFYQICEDTHGGEWANARRYHRDMDNLTIAREGGASEDTLAYLKEALELEDLLN